MPDFQAAPTTLPPGQRVYAIGDVHGCDDKLAILHAAIAEDLAARPAARPLLVHLGDYIDRGPDSAGVIARLVAGPPVPGLPMVNLLGNHERSMIDALAGERAAITDWRFHGGREALTSWDIDPDSDPSGWAASIPAAHRRFVEGLALMHRVGGYLFVHAGIRPGLPLEAQSPDDLIRIRGGFLDSTADFGVVVVHGHTPTREPVLRRNRIGIDTGAAYGRELTCLVLEADRMAFFQA
ncbi:metallophosphoesterase family protein [Belnapia rosea]|uniref:Serine/threonine protein phosphatase 1 n=1 Tax=Belnapia rosea TaxID=938405 RepID=A0A1G6NGZ9_9PROT|nr:metallophosphoesterase family protein [Belnapia rosea]SDB66878.1 serine/threonine protein phosphatase 1 [Belnapia rosea]SDC67088.1 serine/threonine protein phosphatase 1 [Belnapia rosea]